MNFSAWRAFLETCRLGSFSAAAEHLGYTQSAVSRQVAGLEREAGLKLLDRVPNGVRPTVAGRAFLAHAQLAVREADRALVAARRSPTVEAPLRVGATPSIAAGLVPAAVRRLIEERGALPWTMVPGLSSDLTQRILAGELDLAVVTDAPPGLPDHPAIDRRSIGQDEMVVVLPPGHRLELRHRVPLEALADSIWVEDNEGSAALLRQQAARCGFVPRLELDAADLAGKVAFVAAGHAVALIPGALIPALRPDVAVIRLEDPPVRGVFVLALKNSDEPRSARLVELLAESWSVQRATIR